MSLEFAIFHRKLESSKLNQKDYHKVTTSYQFYHIGYIFRLSIGINFTLHDSRLNLLLRNHTKYVSKIFLLKIFSSKAFSELKLLLAPIFDRFSFFFLVFLLDKNPNNLLYHLANYKAA